MAATWQVTTKGGSASSISSVNVTPDASTAIGDLLVAMIVLRGANTGQAVTPPAGWTKLVDPATTGNLGAGQFPTATGSGTNGAAYIYYRTAGSAGAVAASFSWPTGVVTEWFCHRYTGAAGSLVELLGSAVASPATATSLTTSAVTTTEANEPILRHVFGTLASGSTAMTGSGLAWDAACAKVGDIQGAGTSGLAWASAATETGPGTAGAVAGRAITLPNAPIASGTVSIGILSGGGSGTVAPTNSTPPTITTDGTPETGETVTAGGDVWANTPTSYAYAWNRNGTAITSGVGYNTNAYQLQTADVGTSITVTVTASNSAGSASATSAAITPSTPVPVSPPVNTALPAITGTLQAGSVATCSTGSFSNSPTGYAYQWLRNGSPISGATLATRTLTALDVGTAVISCSVTASNSGGSATANAPSVDIAQAVGDFTLDWYVVQ